MASPIQFLLILIVAYTISTIGINGQDSSDDNSATAKPPALQAKDPEHLGRGWTDPNKLIECEKDRVCLPSCETGEEHILTIFSATDVDRETAKKTYDVLKNNSKELEYIGSSNCKSKKCELKDIGGVTLPICTGGSGSTRMKGTFYTVALTLLITVLPVIFGGFVFDDSSASGLIMDKSTFGDAGEKGKELYCHCDDKDGSNGDGVIGTAPTLA